MAASTDPGAHGLDELIHRRDFLAAIKKSISANERPYTRASRSCINADIESFDRSFLSDFLDKNGKLKVRDAWFYLQLYLESLEVERMLSCSSLLVRTSNEQLKPIVRALTAASVEEMRSMSATAVAIMFNTLMNEMKLRDLEEKHRLVFSRSKDPKTLMELVERNKALFTGETSLIPEFSVKQHKEIAEKMAALRETVAP